MADLDELLVALRAQGAPDALSGIDAGVMHGLARRREARAARRGMVMAALVAAFIGVAGSITLSAPASAEPLFGMPSRAPSHLLAD